MFYISILIFVFTFLQYDYESVMHYRRNAFSKNGRDTITTLDPTKQNVIGQRGGLSTIDIEELNAVYK